MKILEQVIKKLRLEERRQAELALLFGISPNKDIELKKEIMSSIMFNHGPAEEGARRIYGNKKPLTEMLNKTRENKGGL